MNDEFDDLDRALFALPLEAPPPGLRESILRATVYAPAPEPAFRTWEIAAIGAALAVAVWLGILLATDRAFGAALTLGALALGRAFSDPATLTWLSVGGGIAIWLTIVNSAPRLRLPIRNGKA